MKDSENTNTNRPETKTDTHQHGTYELQTNAEGVTVRFKSGVTIRLIASQDHLTHSWKVRLPHGVSVDPKIWRTLARRAVWCLVTHVHPEAAKPGFVAKPGKLPKPIRDY